MHVAYIDIYGHWTAISFYQAPRHVFTVSMHLGKAGCALSLQRYVDVDSVFIK